MLIAKEEHGLIILECTFTISREYDGLSYGNMTPDDIKKNPTVARWLSKLEPFGEVTINVEHNITPYHGLKTAIEMRVPIDMDRMTKKTHDEIMLLLIES